MQTLPSYVISLLPRRMNSQVELLMDVQDVMSESENSRALIDSLIPVVDELVLSFSAISKLVPEYKKLEELAFERETTITSLQEELEISLAEAISRAENLACEVKAVSDELNVSNTELNILKEEVSCLRFCSEESESRCQKLETSFNSLVEEKEDLAMQLADALLAMDEEKAMWFAREKATAEAIDEKAKSYSAEITTLSKKMTEVMNELQNSKKQCKLLEERLVVSESDEMLDKSEEKSLEIDQLRLDLRVAEEQYKRSQEAARVTFKSNLSQTRQYISSLFSLDFLICKRECM